MEITVVGELLAAFGDLMIEEIHLMTVQSMGEAEFLQMVAYMEKLQLELHEPLPHSFLVHSGA